MCIEDRGEPQKENKRVHISHPKNQNYTWVMVLYIQLASLSSSLAQIKEDRVFNCSLMFFSTSSMVFTLACHMASLRDSHIWYTKQLSTVQIIFLLATRILDFFEARLLREDILTFDPSHAIVAIRPLRF